MTENPAEKAPNLTTSRAVNRGHGFLTIVILFVAGLAVGTVGTGLVSVVLCQMREASEYSKTAYATKEVIADIDDTLAKGDCKLAAKKVSLFRKRWQEWMDERVYPSSWFRGIINVSR